METPSTFRGLESDEESLPDNLSTATTLSLPAAHPDTDYEDLSCHDEELCALSAMIALLVLAFAALTLLDFTPKAKAPAALGDGDAEEL